MSSNHKDVIQSNTVFKCYEGPNGRNEVQDSYNQGSDELKAKFENALEYLAPLPRQHWQKPAAHRLNKCKLFKDFFEIRFFADDVQQRPIGYFGPHKGQFTIVSWITEKGNRLVPDTWCKTANRRKNEIEGGSAHAVDIKLDTTDCST